MVLPRAPSPVGAVAADTDTAVPLKRPLRVQVGEPATGGRTVLKPRKIDPLTAVFVVHFHTLRGNVVEWLRGDVAEADVDGLEYKAMPSGVHSVRQDYVYFKHGALYGLAAFDNRKVNSDTERGARMRSVGVLCRWHRALHRHMYYLQKTAARATAAPGGLNAAQLGELEEYLGAVNAAAAGGAVPASLSPAGVGYLGSGELPCPFGHLFQFFGQRVFTLWKAMLLGLRILFFAPVPVGVVCDRVHAVCALTSTTLRRVPVSLHPNALFFVNVADLDELTGLQSFVACTSEKIFSEKQGLYDVYVDHREVVVVRDDVVEALRFTAGDRARMKQFRKAVRASDRAGAELDWSGSTGHVRRRSTGAGPADLQIPADASAGATADTGALNGAAERKESAAADEGGGAAHADPGAANGGSGDRPRRVLSPPARRLSGNTATDIALRALFVAANDAVLEALHRSPDEGAICAPDMELLALHTSDAAFLQTLLQRHGSRAEVSVAGGAGCC